MEIASVGALVQEDLKKIIPYLGVEVTAIEAWLNSSSGNHERALSSMLPPSPLEMDGGDAEDFRIFEDVRRINTLCDRLENRTNSLQVAHLSGELMGLPDPSCRLPYGADILILVPSPPGFAAHRLILAARCPTLNKVLLGDYVVADTQSNITIKYIPSPGPLTRPLQGVRGELVFEHVHPFSILILLEFLYSDEVLAIWDPRITASLCLRFTSLGVTPAGVKEELLRLAAMLELSSLRRSVEAPVKRFPHPTMVRDLSRLVVDDSVPVAELIGTNAPLTPDIVLVLGDRDVPCHSTVLRSRTDFFTAFFGSEDWTKNRWTTEGTIRVDLKHLRWDVMKFVVQYIYGGDIELFDRLEFVKTSEELVEFMVQIMAAAVSPFYATLVVLSHANDECRMNFS